MTDREQIVAVSDERVSVPVEPTEEMFRAMYSAMFEGKYDGTQAAMLGAGWDAALAAAPTRPAKEGENERLRKALIWYDNIVRRMRGVEAEQARDMLARDGGERARTALNASEGQS